MLRWQKRNSRERKTDDARTQNGALFRRFAILPDPTGRSHSYGTAQSHCQQKCVKIQQIKIEIPDTTLEAWKNLNREFAKYLR